MEAVKGFIFGRGKTPIGHSYLVSFVIMTDEPLELVSKTGETVVMGVLPINAITPALQLLTKYKPPYPLGDASQAIMSTTDMDPKDLEKVTTLEPTLEPVKPKKRVKKNERR